MKRRPKDMGDWLLGNIDGEMECQCYLVSRGVRKVAMPNEYGMNGHDFRNILKPKLEYFNLSCISFLRFGRKDNRGFVVFEEKNRKHAEKLAKEWSKKKPSHYKIGMLLGYDEEKVKKFCEKD